MLIAVRGMKAVEKAAFGATYKTVWCAGPSIEYVKAIEPMSAIIGRLRKEFKEASLKLQPQA
jgi:nitronate monooxygenase